MWNWKKSPYGWAGIFVRTDVGEEIRNSAIKAGVLYAERDDKMIECQSNNPGHFKKRSVNPKQIDYLKRYGWPVPNAL